MSILINRTFDYIFVGYFASHIIITLLFDTQVFFTFHPEFVSFSITILLIITL